MKNSPFFKPFEQDCIIWESKLTKIQLLFDVWIDVQRQWVYLEGIFSDNSDIQHLLPVESARFQSIHTDFFSIMKKVSKNSLILNVLNIPHIQKSMEKLLEMLNRIQKSLGDYLERERLNFPRFYFLGDLDLLDIVGNNKNINQIQKHFKKMFSGIDSLLFNENAIHGIQSKQGEVIQLKSPIGYNRKVTEWLSELEVQVNSTLVYKLHDSLLEFNKKVVGEMGIISERGSLKENKSENSSFLNSFMEWINDTPDQLIILTLQIAFTRNVESKMPLNNIVSFINDLLNKLSEIVLTDISTLLRKKVENLIIECVYQRDICKSLLTDSNGLIILDSFEWSSQLRYYFTLNESNPLKSLSIEMINSKFYYGWEYLGVCDRLVKTPLTNKCFQTLALALDAGLGASPFGPAGTGKTESVKSLGHHLGRFVLVFCCDENFDFQAMGRIFIGLCKVGGFGCFDEFNRLKPEILSAVSQQVEVIQNCLKGIRSEQEGDGETERIIVNGNTGIFITMNPGYLGRSELPDNLKKLFKSVAMTRPDNQMISQVMLYSQGFKYAEMLARKVTLLFQLCDEQLSKQSHYDFGLRALKNCLTCSGNIKRDSSSGDKELKEINSNANLKELELKILLQSLVETVMPKIVGQDVPLLEELLDNVFPNIKYSSTNMDELLNIVKKVGKESFYQPYDLWIQKIIQLYQIQKIHHGIMIVGPSGSGKSSCWKTLLRSMEQFDGIESVSYVIDPKSVNKEDLYGTLDLTTREWNDGLFTSLLRRIINNVRGEMNKRHWIVFDGDVDPEWVENLNSVLDDNKVLTLPNGERLALPFNVRIIFEVENLNYATPATISRCGMIFHSDEIIPLNIIYEYFFNKLNNKCLDDLEETNKETILKTQRECVEILSPYFIKDGLITKLLEKSSSLDHIMEISKIRMIETLFGLIQKSIRNVLIYNYQNEMSLPRETLEKYIQRKLLISLMWSFVGDSKNRNELFEYLKKITIIEIPEDNLIEFDCSLPLGEWVYWKTKVPLIEVDTQKVSQADVIIPTVDTIRHEDLLYSWLSEHKPIILCGPPGSGKTMCLFSALRKLPEIQMIPLNFSSATLPKMILKTLEQYCEYRKTSQGIILSPPSEGQWIILFCDEINLPNKDDYGTQRVISFLRQLIEQGGFWRSSDKQFIRIERIQFVGACNPPTDTGRKPLSIRFLRHTPLLYVGYPQRFSLKQIYGTFNRSMLKMIPNLRMYVDALTDAMIEFYELNQNKFTINVVENGQGIYECIKPLEFVTLEMLTSNNNISHILKGIWAHEGIRLFSDRLTRKEEREWIDKTIDQVARNNFKNFDYEKALSRPILFSNWLNKNYISVERRELKEFVKARLKVFYEEELDVPIVLFDDVLEHVLRIDRVFKQIQGHLLLIGTSGSGKTTLSKFVAWMNGLNIVQLKVHNKYKMEDFDEDLKTILKRCGCKGEKICFIIDESNVLDSGFLERINTLLANAEIPGLFKDDEYSSLMLMIKEASQKQGQMLDNHDELYKWFTYQIMLNLHVVFTMNPSEDNNKASTSPALFNRCVLDWFGDWNSNSLFQVALEFLNKLDLNSSNDKALTWNFDSLLIEDLEIIKYNFDSKQMFITPRHFVESLNHYIQLYNEKRGELEDQQRHVNVGLDKLVETVEKVAELKKELAEKKIQLEIKNREANEKLQRMVKEQQEAESERAKSLVIKKEMEQQQLIIENQTRLVMEELSLVEPAVIEAKQNVSNIKKQQLTEVRSMGNPPDPVKLTMEAVCILLGHQVDSWKSVQTVLRRDDFINSIVHFDTDKHLTSIIKEKISREYLNNAQFNFETVNRA
ncbi:P-loop containing nucleoside triphosphate hydrolase protein, partial [Rozella allomycis CSF55]